MLGYEWLDQEPGPKMIEEARALLGVHEAPGSVNNPVILGWAKEVGLQNTYSQDSVPWCGLFMAVVAKRAGKNIPHFPLWALNWVNFGQPETSPMLGDVLVFKRDGGGHVGLYVGEDAGAFHVLGGNESDSVTIIRMSRDRLYAARRPMYQVQPANVRVIQLAANGALSTNEA